MGFDWNNIYLRFSGYYLKREFDQMDFSILSLLVWLPVLGAIAIVFVPRDKSNIIKWMAAGFTGLQLVFATILWFNFDKDHIGFQFMEKATLTKIYH